MKFDHTAVCLMIAMLACVGCMERQHVDEKKNGVNGVSEHHQPEKAVILERLTVAVDGSPRVDSANNEVRTEWTISGVLTNVSDTTLPEVEVEVGWYDPAGKLLDSGKARVQDAWHARIEPGRLVTFRFVTTTTSSVDEFNQLARDLLSESKVDVKITSAGRELAFLPGTGWEMLKTPPSPEEVSAFERRQGDAFQEFLRQQKADEEFIRKSAKR